MIKYEWAIYGYYCGQWEEVTAEDSFIEAKERLKEYRKNESGTCFKLKKQKEVI